MKIQRILAMALSLSALALVGWSGPTDSGEAAGPMAPAADFVFTNGKVYTVKEFR